MCVFMAGATTMGRVDFHARATQLRVSSHKPLASLAKVWADNGAITNTSDWLRNSMWDTGSPNWFHDFHSSSASKTMIIITTKTILCNEWIREGNGGGGNSSPWFVPDTAKEERKKPSHGTTYNECALVFFPLVAPTGATTIRHSAGPDPKSAFPPPSTQRPLDTVSFAATILPTLVP